VRQSRDLAPKEFDMPHTAISPSSGLARILVVLLLAGAAGCTGGCATTKAGQRASRAAADFVLPPQQEEQLGEQFSQQVEQELKLHPDERVQSYVRQMGREAVEAAGDRAPEGVQFEFHVVDDPQTINAFAGPGGQIYFYSGLLRAADSKAEVMAVMCHEVAHVTERHIAKSMVTSYGMQALSAAALGRNPGLIASLGSTIAQQGFMLKYSRAQERNADDQGLAFMLKTPYNPEGFVSFFEKLTGGPQPPVFLSSHPPPTDRIERIRSMLDDQESLPREWGREEHRAILDLLEVEASNESSVTRAHASWPGT
jgi:predicted Zn-dependent protease